MTNPTSHKWRMNVEPKPIIATVAKAAEQTKIRAGMIAFAAGAGAALTTAFLAVFRSESKEAGKRELIEEMTKKHALADIDVAQPEGRKL